MTIQYKTKGVCSRQMNVKIENGVIQKVEGFADCIGGGGQTIGDLTCPGVPIG